MAPGAGRILLRLASGLVFAFLMLPLLVLFPISFSSGTYLRFPPPGFSLKWYARYFGDVAWIDATYRSLQIGAATTVLALADRHTPGLRPGARALSRALADRERHLGADHRAAHRAVDRHLRAVLAARADRRMVRRGGRPHRAGAAVRRHRAAGGPARLRCQSRAGRARPRRRAAGGGAHRHAADPGAQRLFGRVPRLHHVVRRAGGRHVHLGRQHDAAQEDVRQHHERDRADRGGGLGDPDRADLGAAAARDMAAPPGNAPIVR